MSFEIQYRSFTSDFALPLSGTYFLQPQALLYYVIMLVDCSWFVFAQVEASPYQYDKHVELIKALRASGDLEPLREAREKMASIYPLSEGMQILIC